MAALVGNAEADGDHVEKGRLRQGRTGAAQVIAGMEDQFVDPFAKALADQDRPAVDTTISIGGDRLQMRPVFPLQVNPVMAYSLMRGALMRKGSSKKNSSRLLPGPSRSTTRKSEGASSVISGWCQTLRR